MAHTITPNHTLHTRKKAFDPAFGPEPDRPSLIHTWTDGVGYFSFRRIKTKQSKITFSKTYRLSSKPRSKIFAAAYKKTIPCFQLLGRRNSLCTAPDPKAFWRPGLGYPSGQPATASALPYHPLSSAFARVKPDHLAP